MNEAPELLSKTIYELVKEGYGAYQTYVNDGRYIPAAGDGLKRVQRRYILTTKEVAKSKFVKSASVLGQAMSMYHPHGAAPETLATLVRNGFITGQGNFGSTTGYRSLPSANERYTEVKYNKALDNILFRFEDYFIYEEGELGNKEPEFLIVPISYALLRGSIGIGVGGARCKIPAFTYESLLEAYEKDDPSVLKSTYGMDIDHQSSTLRKLWDEGSGKVVFKHKVVSHMNGSVELVGDATAFTPDLTTLLKWEANGWISISDRTTDKMKLIFRRESNIRKITDQEIYDEVLRVSKMTPLQSTHLIMFSHKGSVIKMGIKGWLKLTMDMYRATFQKWQHMEVEKHNKVIERLKWIPKISALLLEGKSTKAISGETGKTMKFVQSIEALPMRMLRKTDFTDQVRKYEKLIDEVKSSKVEDMIKSGCIVDTMLNQT